MKKILVVGANSFIGSHLISKIRDKAIVVGIYNTNVDKIPTKIKTYSIDEIRKLKDDFEIVYLLSAYITKEVNNFDERKKMFNVNVELVDKICNKFKHSKVVYSSSVSVYKEKGSEIFEFDNEGGLNEYGVSKMWGEKIIKQLSNYSIIRFSSVYGIGMNQSSIIPVYIDQALKNNIINVWGDGTRKQNYLHISDAINFLIKASESKNNGIYLGAFTNSISNKELAEIIAQQTNSKVSFIGEDNSPSFCYNNQLTVEELGYSGSFAIENGISELIKWTKEKY